MRFRPVARAPRALRPATPTARPRPRPRSRSRPTSSRTRITGGWPPWPPFRVPDRVGGKREPRGVTRGSFTFTGACDARPAAVPR
jgi:hypothetical protein